MAKSALTDANRQALHWLRDHGGEGVLDRYGALIAQGARYKGTGAAQTWLRLFTLDMVESAGPSRLRISPFGAAAVADAHGYPASPSTFAGARERAPMLDEDEAA